MVSESSGVGLPAWVTKRDGRVEPFDADKICAALFVAGEDLGAANAFIARELTDAVLHFLAVEATDSPVATAHISEQVVKVVRELGQPTLAQAFARGADRKATVRPEAASRPSVHFDFSIDESPRTVAERCLRTYSEHAVFSRDLIAAQNDGLLLLAGLETPRALARAVLELPEEPAAVAAFWTDLPAVCEVVGAGLVLDGPEWHRSAASPLGSSARELIGQLTRIARRPLLINLNAAQPPAWARQRLAGPLFDGETTSEEPTIAPWLEVMDRSSADRSASSLGWLWHLQARDFIGAAARDRLRQLAEHVLAGAPIAFAFDRARRPIALAEGMDRQRPAVLMEIGLDLGAFLRMSGISGHADTFRNKLATLARMAVSAGAQKRKYLRRHAEGTLLARAFLLERAALAVVPVGLNAVVRALTGQSPAASPLSLQFACELVQRLHDELQNAGRSAHLDVALDSPGPGLASRLPPEASADAGLSCIDSAVGPERQLLAAGALHVLTGHGTAEVRWPAGAAPTADALVELLQFAWRRTELVRLRFVQPDSEHQQAELPM
jgi:hypothetical protein